MIKRTLDISLSLLTLLIFSPFFLLISIIIAIESKGGVFYKQIRVGKDNRDFKLLKFRSMFAGSDCHGLLTIGNCDKRVTKFGSFLRKYKIDEFPQLLNIIKGDMSIVGPRPEVRKYVDLYDDKQMKVLTVRPGLTDYASIKYINECEILANCTNPEEIYIKEIMPHKIELNLEYIKNQSITEDIRIIMETIFSIGKEKKS